MPTLKTTLYCSLLQLLSVSVDYNLAFDREDQGYHQEHLETQIVDVSVQKSC